MAITLEDLQVIRKEFDKEYVRIVDCNDIQDENKKKLANDDKRIEIITHDFATVKKLMWAVASASIGSLVVAFFELILK
jgi:hypothetical protein